MRNRCSLAAALLAILFTVMSCQRTQSIADELIGVWRTQAINYRGAFIELGKDQISFGTETGEVFDYVITRVKRQQDRNPGLILYTLYYVNESSQTYELPFYYQTSGQGTIFFKNKPYVIWSRDQT